MSNHVLGDDQQPQTAILCAHPLTSLLFKQELVRQLLQGVWCSCIIISGLQTLWHTGMDVVGLYAFCAVVACQYMCIYTPAACSVQLTQPILVSEKNGWPLLSFLRLSNTVPNFTTRRRQMAPGAQSCTSLCRIR